ncbi:Cytochrome P450, E-class, group I [Trema orientale]|uniref:Cytochrome P450, E-class, group I n=1 Tax=Trema orientale TaxID=63057 RepID=A0A2P5F555_TREOI|nr:Cytochrome P450, E-class, group I [Trema orientale]
MLSNENLDVFYALRRKELKRSVRDVYSKVGTPINVGGLAFLTGGTLDGEKEKRLGAEFRTALSQLISQLGKPNISDFFPALAWLDVQGVERNMKKVSNWMEHIFDFVIAQKRKLCEVDHVRAKEKKYWGKDFMEVLMDYKDHDTGVGNHHMVQRKSHLNKLTYLHAVVKETLRLHPVAPLLLPRSPTKSCTVGGYTIPKGTKVFLNAWAMHRGPQFWANPTEFRPERFLEAHDESKLDYSGNNLSYIPFGAGRRMRAGLVLGERMLMHVLAVLLHLFEWELPSGARLDSEEKLGIVLEKSTPLVVVPVPRLSNLDLCE